MIRKSPFVVAEPASRSRFAHAVQDRSGLPLFALGAALFATCLSGFGCSGAPKTVEPEHTTGEVSLSADQIKNAHLSIAPAEERDVGGAVVSSGRVTFDDLRVTHVFSPVSGRVVNIMAQPGQHVKKGAPLCVIESPDVASAFSDMSKAEADLIAAEHDFKRNKELFEAHAGSQRDYETSEDNYQKAKAEMDRAKQKARLFRDGNADRVTQSYTLKALIDGQIISRGVNPGTEVSGQYAQGNAVELFTIGELDSVWVLADIFEIDLAKIKKAARVSVRVVSYPNKIFEGKVDWVADSLDAASRTAKVRCSISNPQYLLKPEMYATVSISVAERKALVIPRSAMLRLNDQAVVFVQTGSDSKNGNVKFERRPIAVDEDEGGDFLPVTHGLNLGEKVVTDGAILLSGMI